MKPLPATLGPINMRTNWLARSAKMSCIGLRFSFTHDSIRFHLCNRLQFSMRYIRMTIKSNLCKSWSPRLILINSSNSTTKQCFLSQKHHSAYWWKHESYWIHCKWCKRHSSDKILHFFRILLESFYRILTFDSICRGLDGEESLMSLSHLTRSDC